VKVIAVAADITTEAGRDAIWSVAGGPGKAYDIVVTNAGGPPPGDFRDWDREQWIKAVDANMLTPIELIKATVDGMAERGFGRIINITSGAVKAPIDVLGLSNGARSGLAGFAGGLARQTVARGVTVNNLLPGIFDSDAQKRHIEGMLEPGGKTFDEIWKERAAANPTKRYGNPDELGAYCAFLCSVHAGYITGQNLVIDGGSFPGAF